MQVTTSIVLDKRKQLKDSSYPVKLRIIYNRKSRLYKTGLSLTEEEFKKTMGKAPKRKYKDYRLELNQIEAEAIDAIEKMDSFSFETFKSKFKKKAINTLDIFEVFKIKIDELKKEEQLGTMNMYKYALSSLRNFTPTQTLHIKDVTVPFLKRYEKWMLAKGRSLTTIGIYMRDLRTVYNMAIEENQIKNINYPFGKKKYQIPAPRNVKKSLTIKEIKLLYEYKPEPGSSEQKYRDLWFFSYLCNGINMKDICLLQHKNIQGGHIYFYRKKTINSVRDSEPIDVVLLEETKAILDRWATKSDYPEAYVFPFITHDMSAERKDAATKQVTKLTNKYIRRIAQKVGIDKPVSTYWARHSYATILMRANVGTEFISKQLGHKSLKTTANYLGSFEDDAKTEIAKKLLDF